MEFPFDVKLTEQKYIWGTAKIFDLGQNSPILIKILEATDNLSVQVHPTDEYAKKVENIDCGKNEMWYVLECSPDSFVYCGFNDNVTREMLENELLKGKGDIEGLLKKVPIKKGDTVFIPSGTVHALTKGVTVLEIQQNSDITYRLYDYNRKDENGNLRELHINKSLDVIDL